MSANGVLVVLRLLGSSVDRRLSALSCSILLLLVPSERERWPLVGRSLICETGKRLRRLQASKFQRLGRFQHVSDAVVPGAVERAVRHSRFSNRAAAPTISIHLGFVPSAWTTRNLRPQLERLVEDGALTVSFDQSVRGWKVTQQGHMRLNRLRRAGELVLPESPQHRAWREARTEAEQGMEEFSRRAVPPLSGTPLTPSML